MARNKLEDLNNHLFAQLERLGDEELKGDDLTAEVERGKAISNIAKQVIDTAKTTLQAVELISSGKVRVNNIPEQFGLKK